MTVNRGTVRALNALTARWAHAAPAQEGTVFAAAGVWPLLGLLAEGADAAVRGELTRTLGLPPDRAGRAARALLAALDGMDGVTAATGLWTRAELPLRAAWSRQLPPHAHAPLSGDPAADAAALDRWARERTGGRIASMPVDLDPYVWLVLASALVLRTRWERPFDQVDLRPPAGPWQGQPLAGLSRSSRDLDEVCLARTSDGEVTAVTVRGDNGLDVQLLLGEAGLGPGQVIGTGLGLLDAARTARTAKPGGALPGEPLLGEVRPGRALPVGSRGPGLSVTEQPSTSPDARLDVTVPRFEVTAEHDLLTHADLFGLTTATDGGDRHFPGISPDRLALRSARQSATATFDEAGFEAAAVTAAGIAWMSGADTPRHTAKVLTVTVDRPFAFLAVHRDTQLCLAAGWVTSAAGGPGPAAWTEAGNPPKPNPT
ncbi:serpin family protein [Streptomyces sp. Da 82-17]|uniref:serpin family protein n=1 Tax=Streptomyces sp. Da 82-17 TaxID=3377116 RepID=UPI0038D4394F